MKTNLTLVLFALLIMVGRPFNLSGQVTIGSNTEPLDVSVLELISNATSIPKGLRLPQLTLIEIDALTSNINQLASDEEKARAKGIIIFNTTTSCTMVWNGKEFKSLCGDIGPAEIVFDCANMQVYPTDPDGYRQGTPIDGNTAYIKIPVTVTKAGTYKIRVTTGNGYSFFTDGSFFDVGSYVITLFGSGTPITGGTSYYDELHLIFNEEHTVLGCESSNLPKIPVLPAIDKATYDIVCNNVNILGTYIINSELNTSHHIDVQVNITNPGFYSISAESAGMHFSRSGQWPTGTTGLQTVTLLSEGKPTQAGVIPISIIGETANGNITCEKNITVSYRTIKILSFGEGAYQPGTAIASQSSKAILQSSTNFGLNGTVPTQGITIINGGYSAIANMINTHNPDIIIFGYAAHPLNDGANNALVDFIQNKKGVILAFTEGAGYFSYDAAMINAICGSSITVGASGGAGSLYQLLNIDHPILNGPFGDIREKYWGEDATTTSKLNNLPDGATALTANLEAIVYGNNFLWVGDGGFLAGSSIEPSPTIWPCKIDTNGVPIPKPNYGPTATNRQPVYNSIFYANAIAWAINYVQINR